MLIKITSKCSITLPPYILEKLNVSVGDTLSFSETEDGFLIRKSGFNPHSLAPLRDQTPANLQEPDLESLRPHMTDPELRE
jgi:bifunctional DNA-binding transcriptional regulator/antitoxin component of YhaV-PrlF toxin-antitoxin module